jgi:DNA-binding Lrp family transcriptional regulator
LAEIQDGLPLEPAPYAAVARRLGITEAAVIERLGELKTAGLVRRFGVVVRHHELGYRANAMVVWDIADEAVRAAGGRLAELPFVTLCYRRPRRPPDWPYNLFTMIHGRDRRAVEALVDEAATATGLEAVPREVLFSRRRFKQRGACYAAPVAERVD